MSRLMAKMVLVAGLGAAAAGCQDSGQATAPRYGYAPGTPYYNTGYYAPPPGYARPAPAYYYGGQPTYYGGQPGYYGGQPQGWYNRADGRRYTTVTVTNRGQNGHRDDVVQQQVVCGSQYYDGYRTQTAPSC